MRELLAVVLFSNIVAFAVYSSWRRKHPDTRPLSGLPAVVLTFVLCIIFIPALFLIAVAPIVMLEKHNWLYAAVWSLPWIGAIRIYVRETKRQS